MNHRAKKEEEDINKTNTHQVNRERIRLDSILNLQ